MRRGGQLHYEGALRPGQDIREVLGLNDSVVDLKSPQPARLSDVRGLARKAPWPSAYPSSRRARRQGLRGGTI
jgi:hypothetical protein